MLHDLVLLAREIDWEWLDAEIGELYAGTGRAVVPSRFILGLLLLRQIYGLSDERRCARGTCDLYFQRHERRMQFSRTRLCRLIGDIRRKTDGDVELREIFARPLSLASQNHGRRQRQRRWKLSSWHAPETECLGCPKETGSVKGKAGSPYEFGFKVFDHDHQQALQGWPARASRQGGLGQFLRRSHAA